MRKIRFIAVMAATLALAALMLAGCSSGSSASSSSTSSSGSAAADSSSSSASSEDFTLVVGFDAEFPPYGYIGDDGEYTGFDLELAEAVCEENGWEFEAEPIDWDAKDALLNSGTINCIWNGFTMEGREGQYTFSDPYMLNEQVIVVRADSDITSLADLADKTVLTQVDSAALDVLEAPAEDDGYADVAVTFAGGAPQTIDTFMNAFMQLESGLVDAVACDLSVFANQDAANPGAFKVIETLSSEHFAVGFAKGDTETAEAVTAALEALDADGVVEELCAEYADQGISYDNWVL